MSSSRIDFAAQLLGESASLFPEIHFENETEAFRWSLTSSSGGVVGMVQIGWVLRRRSLRWWQGRVFVAKSEKALLTLRSLRDLKPITVPAHKKKLHQDLQGLAGVDPE